MKEERISFIVPKEVKRKFKVALAKDGRTMTEVLADFVSYYSKKKRVK